MPYRSTVAWTLLGARCVAAIALVGCGARSGLRTPDASEADSAMRADAIAAGRVVDDSADVRDAVDVTVTAICGNARVEPGEQCDFGAMNGLVPAFAVAQSGVETVVQPVARGSSAIDFYRYESASAHTSFEALELANLFLYVDTRTTTNDLALFAIAGVDDTVGGMLQPVSMIEAHFTGVPTSARVAMSDDPGEFLGGLPGTFNAVWSFSRNTDGGVISGLPWETAWTITADEMFASGITAWHYVDHGGSARTLALDAPTLLIHRITASACRPDCRLPRCGDGFVDAGERCDDGNTASGDGCAATCQRIE